MPRSTRPRTAPDDRRPPAESPGLPEIVGVTEYRDIIGVAIQKAIEGAASAQVLADAQKEFQDMLNKTEG